MDFIPTSFFKSVMIVLLKMQTADKSLGKICLKAIIYLFPNMWFIRGRTGGKHEGKRELNFFVGKSI